MCAILSLHDQFEMYNVEQIRLARLAKFVMYSVNHQLF